MKTPTRDDANHTACPETKTTAVFTRDMNISPAPILALFKFASSVDIMIMTLGIFFCICCAATRPGISVAFGNITNAIADPTDNIREVMRTALLLSASVSVFGFVTYFLGFGLCGLAASRIANGFRAQYLDAVLRQDAAFFDFSDPGEISLAFSDCSFDIQNGLSDKFAAMLQGLFQFILGFGVAFYHGPRLALVLAAFTPLIAVGISFMVVWGSKDGIYGKRAYERASSTASEALLNFRTVLSLNAETTISKKYDNQLQQSEEAAIRQSSRVSLMMALFLTTMFSMYGVGLWYGAGLIANSTEEAILHHPAPPGLFDTSLIYDEHREVISDSCSSYMDKHGVTEAYKVCACNIPWDFFQLESPNCGCGFYDGNEGPQFITNSGCFTGGRTIVVFFCIMFAGFSIGQVGPGISAIGDARIAAAKMLKVIERRPSIDTEITEGKIRLTRDSVKGDITLENVYFRYCPENNADLQKDVFSGCNLTFKAGETVALVGESGCGKSTMAKLVQRLYDPTEGRILLDGVDLRDLALCDLTANIGVVCQEPLLFNKSIKDNIKYGWPDASDDDIIKAAQNANAHIFISQFPDGYDTLVGPKGNKLSGGQKQRVAIARALLRQPKILILDEATSALDNKNEKIVQQALDQLVKNNQRQRTTLVIAHRLSTIRNADKIIVFGSQNGASTASAGSIILEEGSHDELMSLSSGFYKALVGAGDKNKKNQQVGNEIDYTTSDLVLKSAKKKVETKKNSTRKKKDVAKKRFWSKLSCEKKSGAEIEKKNFEKQQVKIHKGRLWKYSTPEMPLIVIGTFISMCKGTLMPLLSVFFSKLLILFYSSDTNLIRFESFRWSLFLYLIAFLTGLFEFIQTYIFEKVGERLTSRLRSDTFRAMLRQDVTWFEDEKNSIGSLSSRLSTDVKVVRLLVGQSIAASLESMSALATGIIISSIASWEIFLVMLATVPLLGMVKVIQSRGLKGKESSIRNNMISSITILLESVNGIREVKAFSLETMIAREIKTSLSDTIVPAAEKAALIKGIGMGLTQSVQFLVYTFAFWDGGELITTGSVLPFFL